MGSEAKRVEFNISIFEWQKVTSEAFTKLLNFLPDPIVICDLSGSLVFINSSTETLFQYEPGELLGTKIENLIPERFREAHQLHRTDYCKEPQPPRPMGVGLDLWGINKKGTEFPVDVSIGQIKLENHKFFIAVIRDISERKKIENERDEALKEREEIMSMIVHDLRTPLTSILITVDLIEKTLKLEEANSLIDKKLNRIKWAATNINNLIENILRTKKHESEMFSVTLTSIKVSDLISNIIEVMRPIAERKSLHLELASEVPEQLTISCDEERIFQVFSNLISNSIRYTPENGKIEIEIEPIDNMVKFSISDTGSGISPDNLKNIFDKKDFFQRSIKGGTGLGLIIVKNIVEAHHGNIEIESTVGKGTTVRFTIPSTI